MFLNRLSFAICNSYPEGWGFNTSVHLMVIGSVSVVPLAGESGEGGGGSGLL